MLQTLLEKDMEESPDQNMKFPREREHLPYGARLESWGCSSWRGEGCGESSQHPPGSAGATEEEEELWTRSWSGRIMENGLEWQDNGEWAQTDRGEV